MNMYKNNYHKIIKSYYDCIMELILEDISSHVNTPNYYTMFQFRTSVGVDLGLLLYLLVLSSFFLSNIISEY